MPIVFNKIVFSSSVARERNEKKNNSISSRHLFIFFMSEKQRNGIQMSRNDELILLLRVVKGETIFFRKHDDMKQTSALFYIYSNYRSNEPSIQQNCFADPDPSGFLYFACPDPSLLFFLSVAYTDPNPLRLS